MQKDGYSISLAGANRDENLKKYMTPERQQALRQVIENKAKAAENLNKAFESQPELRKFSRFDSDKGEYSLDKMADLVNGAAEINAKKAQELANAAAKPNAKKAQQRTL